MKTILCYGDPNTYGSKPIDIDMLETPFVSTSYRFSKEKTELELSPTKIPWCISYLYLWDPNSYK